MASTIEVDLLLKRAVRLLHSSSSNSATELRQMLDDVIKNKYGADKMLSKTLSKAHLEEEKNFPGRLATPPLQPIPQEDEIINLTTSPDKTLSDSPDESDEANSSAIIINNTAPPILTAADEDVNLKEFGDLNCCVCGEMMFTATNRLIECSICGALYHQECHKPAISNEDASEDREHQWQCDNCNPTSNKSPIPSTPDVVVISDDNLTPKAANKGVKVSPTSNLAFSQTSSSSSTSSSRNRRTSSISHREERTSKSSSIVTPTINVISASERSATHSKRHASSKTRSRQTESASATSSRRKLNK